MKLVKLQKITYHTGLQGVSWRPFTKGFVEFVNNRANSGRILFNHFQLILSGFPVRFTGSTPGPAPARTNKSPAAKKADSRN